MVFSPIRAAKLNPDQDETLLALGKAFFTTGNYQKALDSYLKVKDIEFDDIDVNYFIAMTYGKLNNPGESHYYFGLHFKKDKKNESALFHFKEALNYFSKDKERNEVILKEIKELENENKKFFIDKPSR